MEAPANIIRIVWLVTVVTVGTLTFDVPAVVVTVQSTVVDASPPEYTSIPQRPSLLLVTEMVTVVSGVPLKTQVQIANCAPTPGADRNRCVHV